MKSTISEKLPILSPLEIGFLFLIIIALWFFQKFIFRNVLRKVSTYLRKKELMVQAIILEQLTSPTAYLFFFTSIFISFTLLTSVLFWEHAILSQLYHTIFISLLIVGLYRVLGYFAEHPDEWTLFAKKKINEVIFPFLCRLGKYSSLFLGVTIVLSLWGYNMNGFVAGLGIGGIALALGAKDVLSNVFGGMAVVLDRPFSIGDWISTEDKKWEGIVEDINFRSTRLHTFDKAIIYIPNSLLANQPIYNYTRRDKRRVKFSIGFSLDTPEHKVRSIMEEITGVLINHKGVYDDGFHVFLDEYSQTSINVLIIYFTNTSEFQESMQIKEDVNFAIMKLMEEYHSHIAPSHHHICINKTTS